MRANPPPNLVLYQIIPVGHLFMQNIKQNGGKRPGGGRPKGSPNRNRAAQIHVALEMVEEGVTPLDIMRARMLLRPLNNGVVPTDDQFAAACALAPYLHPKLSASIIKELPPEDLSEEAVNSRIWELLDKVRPPGQTIEGDLDEQE